MFDSYLKLLEGRLNIVNIFTIRQRFRCRPSIPIEDLRFPMLEDLKNPHGLGMFWVSPIENPQK